MIGGLVILIILILAIAIVASCIKIVPQAQAYVVERLGAYQDTWSVGLHFKVPIVDKVAKRVLLKEQVADFPPQPVITKDNVTMRIDTVVFVHMCLAQYGTVHHRQDVGTVVFKSVSGDQDDEVTD